MEHVILASVICICITVLAWQWSRFYFLQLARAKMRLVTLSDALEEKIKGFDDLKKQVEGLALRVGLR